MNGLRTEHRTINNKALISGDVATHLAEHMSKGAVVIVSKQ